jgi:hypothetical protein
MRSPWFLIRVVVYGSIVGVLVVYLCLWVCRWVYAIYKAHLKSETIPTVKELLDTDRHAASYQFRRFRRHQHLPETKMSQDWPK